MAAQSFKTQLTRTGVTAGAIVAVLVVLHIVLWTDVSHRSIDIAALRDDLARRRQATQVLASLTEQSKKADQYLLPLSTALPTAEDIYVNFRKDLKAFASSPDLQMTLHFTATEALATAQGPGSVPFDLSVQGPPAAVAQFLPAFEKSKYFVSLSSVSLTRTGATASLSTSGKVFTK